ncbi:hypothetical protein GCM10011579_050130 [Streptomyces albiflavescens]|uniref:Uncharacterized protein n=1 Tax=Streptomyces albiflavescens TaxID=1623582 RepID=A0A917Y6H9_9ACTN|nr:hypothetical protein GCM10011579_050130 [Streptomyces albiflavescens]
MARAEPDRPAPVAGGRRGVTFVSGPPPGRAEEAVVSQEAVPQQGASAPPKGLLQQMEELMAALNADLTQLDAELSGGRARGSGEVDHG